MKKELTFVLGILMGVLMMISVATFAHAGGVTITTPDGKKIPLDSLNNVERQNMIDMMDKISKAQEAAKANDLLGQVANADPDKLDSWRKLITGTIKDICNDLNVTVNEFITTPAGMGVAALIIYKVAGKDVLGSFFDVILAIPMWLTVVCVLFYVQRSYLGHTTVYRHVKEYENEKGKKIVEKTQPERVCRYEWRSSDARSVLAAVLYGSLVVISITTICIVFVY